MVGCVAVQGDQPKGITTLYNCGGTPLSARQVEEGKLTLNVNGKTVDVTLTEATNGLKYTNLTPPPQANFTSKGNNAILEFEGKNYPACQRATRSVGYIDTLNYRAIGNDPSWYATITNNEIRLTTSDEEKTLVSPLPAPQLTLSGQYYSIKSANHVMSMTIKNRSCQDSINGQFYPHEVSIIFDGEVYKGCGTNLGETDTPVSAPSPAPNEPVKVKTTAKPVATPLPAPSPAALMKKSWFAKEIDGNAVGETARPVLTFEEDGKLVGNGGCNSISGQYKLSGRSLKIDPKLAMTRMACDIGVMAQEKAFTDILLASNLIELRNDTLIIAAPNRKTMTFTTENITWK